MSDLKCELELKSNIVTIMRNGYYDEGKSLLEKYKIICPNDPEAYSIEAVMFLEKNEFEKAEKVLTDGINRHPYDEDLLFNMSYLKDITNRGKEAEEYYIRGKIFNSNSNIKYTDIIRNYDGNSKSKNLRVIQGTMEIANQMNLITRELRNRGIEAKNINYYPTYLKYDSDSILDINAFSTFRDADLATKEMATKIINENDVFHFHFGTSLTLDYSDLKILKELGKKVVMQYWGSDVRMYSKAVKLNPYVCVKNMDEEGIKKQLNEVSNYISDCIVDYELAEYVGDFYENIHYSRVAMDLSQYSYVKNVKNKKFLIVHAPTSPEFKGTKYILEAIEGLKEKYDFEFKLICGMSHEEAKKWYRQADLIIDQILTGSYGVFAVEAMAMGKPVICWIDDFMREKYPKELPIVSANPSNIKEKIEHILNNKDDLEEIGIQGRKYAEKYHDVKIICNDILKIYEKL